MTAGAGAAKRVAAAAIGRKITPPTVAAPQKPTISWAKVGSPAGQRTGMATPISETGKSAPKPRQPAVDLGAIKVGGNLRHKGIWAGGA